MIKRIIQKIIYPILIFGTMIIVLAQSSYAIENNTSIDIFGTTPTIQIDTVFE